MIDLGTIGPFEPLGERGARQLLPMPTVRPRHSREVSLAGGLAQGSVLSRERPLDPGTPVVLVIGAFDGFHRGHQALLARGAARAQDLGCDLVAVTFSPDPAEVLSGPRPRQTLMWPDQRVDALFAAGAGHVALLGFTTGLAGLSYREFVVDVLCRLADVRALVVGSDFVLGRGGEGSVAALSGLGRELGFAVEGMALADEGGSPITSTRIRALVCQGRVSDAASLLGHLHGVGGRVTHGRGQGTGLGFPTANVVADPRLCLPAEAVYAGYARVGQTAYPAAVNVGRPRSFGPEPAGEPFMEATLLGFEGDLYEREVEVLFVRWLRWPRAFSSVEDLERTVLGNVDWVRRTLGDRGIRLGEGDPT